MVIVDNRKAFHDFFIEERLEAGIMLEGWEVKSIRAGRVQIKELTSGVSEATQFRDAAFKQRLVATKIVHHQTAAPTT